MEKTVFLLDMFSDYEPPEGMKAALSQAAIAAADIHLESRSVQVAAHSPSYIPRRLLETAEREVAALYGLSRVEITVTHPASELQKIEPEELMMLFVSRNSMTRGTLAGAKWEWEGQAQACDGMTLFRFDAQDKIAEVREFAAKAEHTLVYGE